MPIRVLGLALTLSLAIAARSTAKPPDLPQPTTADFKACTPTVDFVPLLEPMSAKGCAEGEECESSRPAVTQAGCCGLFTFCPLFQAVWQEWLTSSHCDEDAVCPATPLVRDLSIWMSSGPFGAPAAPKTAEKLPVAPRDVSVCPHLAAKQKKVVQRKPSKAEVMKRVRGYVKAAALFEELGFSSDARDCYKEIRRLVPRTRYAREAATRLEALRGADKKATQAETSAEESDALRSSAVPAEPMHVFAAYDVSDLVGETIGNNARETKVEAKLGDELVRFIQQTIKRGSWEAQGGKAAVEYRSETNSLVIRHDQEVQQQVADLLANLRYLHKFGGAPAQWLVPLNEKMRGSEEPSSEAVEPKTPEMALMGLDIRELLTLHEVIWDRSTDALKVVAKYDPEGMSAELIRLIENGISPDSWVSRGGQGHIDYNSELKTIFVTNTSEVLEDVASLIQSRRRELQLAKERCEQEVKTSELKRQVRWGKPLPKESPFAMEWGRSSALFDGHKSLVDALLQESHEALEKGQRERAETLARCALSMDRKAVMEHPLVYKMQLLAQVFPEAKQVPMQPRMPAVDPAVVRAYTELLEVRPATVTVHVIQPKKPAMVKTVKPALLQVKEEEYELEIVAEGKTSSSSCCCDVDVQNGRLRLQVQMGPWTFKVLDEGKGKAFSLSLKCCSKE